MAVVTGLDDLFWTLGTQGPRGPSGELRPGWLVGTRRCVHEAFLGRGLPGLTLGDGIFVQAASWLSVLASDGGSGLRGGVPAHGKRLPIPELSPGPFPGAFGAHHDPSLQTSPLLPSPSVPAPVTGPLGVGPGVTGGISGCSPGTRRGPEPPGFCPKLGRRETGQVVPSDKGWHVVLTGRGRLAGLVIRLRVT